MSVRPTLETIIGLYVSNEDVRKFSDFVNDHEEETIADLLTDSPLLSEERFFPILPQYLKMTLAQVARSMTSEKLIGFLPFFHLKEASVYDHQLVWALLEAGLLPDEVLVKKIPYQDYKYALNHRNLKQLPDIPLSVKMDLVNYEGSWGRKYSHSRLNYFDDEFDLTLALFEKIGITYDRNELERFLVLTQG